MSSAGQPPQESSDVAGTGAEDQSLVIDGYNAVYSHATDSPTLQRLWRAHASGPDYPPEYGHISFLTLEEANRLSTAASLDPGEMLVDLACGTGGPGLLIAKQADALLTGIDLSSVGIDRAIARSERVGLVDHATFRVGSFEATGLDDAFADAVMTIDALQYSLDKMTALAEISRILKPGGRFVLTAFEVEPAAVQGYPVIGADPVRDYEPLMEAAGLAVELYDETPGWNDRVTAAYQAVLDQADPLTAELGVEGYASFSLEVSITLGIKPYRRRVLAVATNR